MRGLYGQYERYHPLALQVSFCLPLLLSPPPHHSSLLAGTFFELVYRGMSDHFLCFSLDAWPCATTVGKLWLHDSQRRITCARKCFSLQYPFHQLENWLMG